MEKTHATAIEDVAAIIAPSKAEDSNEYQAAIATTVEHQLTFFQAMRYYKKAVFWSVMASMAVIMESYDLQIIGSFYALPQFQQKYGVQLRSGAYSIPAQWQVGLSVSSGVGVIIGTIANGYLSDKFGRKRVMLACHASLIGLIFITFFAPNVQVLLAGEVLCGLPWGVFSSLAPTYAAEVAPLALRGYLTTYVNLCWVIGHIIATGVLQSQIHNPTEWSYKIPFAVQWLWPVCLIPILSFAPESPWWLARKERHQEAEATLRRLVSAPEDVINPKNTLAMINHTIRTEEAMNIGTSYLDLFRGTNLRRTEIASIAWAGQGIVGFVVQAYITYFFTLAGLSTDSAFKLSLGVFSIAFFGTSTSWLLLARFGRRPMYITGLCIMCPIMAVVGFLDLAPSSPTIVWVQSGILLLWFLTYGLTVGPLPFVIAAEVGAVRLRVKTISFARDFYYLFPFLGSIVGPYMMNPTAGNLRGKAAFPAAGMTIIWIVWAYFRLPETKGRTYEELDILFERKVATKKFAKYDIYGQGPLE